MNRNREENAIKLFDQNSEIESIDENVDRSKATARSTPKLTEAEVGAKTETSEPMPTKRVFKTHHSFR